MEIRKNGANKLGRGEEEEAELGVNNDPKKKKKEGNSHGDVVTGAFKNVGDEKPKNAAGVLGLLVSR